MQNTQQMLLFLLRVLMGWFLFYAGITKVLNPEWSAAGFLNNAKTFPEFFQFFATPAVLPLTNFLNEWGLTLIGLALMLGVFVRLSAILGAALMVLYYFPTLDFPYPSVHTFIVDDHVIYAVLLLYLAWVRAGRVVGLEKWLSSHPKIIANVPTLRRLI
ncbi:hypothetical protein COU20_03390 [Candidatus Kaiserbacteria bacterium CG10_big_fil_rev_8_21_14_0_10_59_10]|uniref:DoxX family protein n=1 Tax=Candidatus Kaiserbacteria bacterium CG10_big_fil_rev_8_21_14_0_10_59_10 TaxID=1974612 RepID=A0A2H0U6X7_9BACT|nr:MAG: hypothetical protein COU20_03390 [Candidatus Kaiserbacteria bacterium CG10_big_fil_rev_8_21_14_0_10_59_10]